MSSGKLFVIEIGLCELRQVVTFLYNFIGEIFFIVIFPLIFIPEITYKVGTKMFYDTGSSSMDYSNRMTISLFLIRQKKNL